MDSKNLQSGEVISNEHPDFMMLMFLIDKIIRQRGCMHDHSIFHGACDIIENASGFKIDRNKTLNWMESHGGYCDCEILMNAQFVD